MAENYSHLQKLCLDTIQSGAIGAFIELFRLTHMEQPLGNNQPQSFEDLIGTAGAEAPQLAPLFSFDSPLGMPLNQLQVLQQLLQQADNAGLQRDLFQQFCCLSAVSDFFLQNHKLRLRVKMLPLVMPYPQYVQLMTSKLDQLFRLVDSPDFNLPIQEEDPLVAAVSKLKDMRIQKQTFPPVVISYAVRARNCLFEYLQMELQGYDISDLMPLLVDADLRVLQPQKDKPLQPLPEALGLKFLTLLTSCYLRLGVSLQQFNLFRAAYQIFQLFLKAVSLLEQKLKISFSDKYVCGKLNGYQRLLKDEQINVDPEKKDDNLAFASLALPEVPALYETVLDRRQIPCLWELTSEENGQTLTAQETFQRLQIPDMAPIPEVEKTTSVNHRPGTPADLCEFVYAGRQMAVMNCVQLACQIYGQQAMSTEGIDVDVQYFDDLLRGHKKGEDAGKDLLTTSQLADPTLPIRCSYSEFLLSISLLYKALNLSLDCKIYSTTLPSFKRFAELAATASLFQAAEPLCSRVAAVNIIFEITALAWQARFARLQNRLPERLALLEKRLAKSKQAAQENAEHIGFVVSAASELVFNSPGNDVSKMEEAWNDLQKQSQQLSNAVIEARVRFGAVRGAAQAETGGLQSPAAKLSVEEGRDEDLDDAALIE